MASSTDGKLEFIEVDPQSPSSSSVATTASTSFSEKKSDHLLSHMSGAIRKAKHPMASMFHLLFKGLAILVYILASFLSGSYVFIFVISILLLAFDFWTVKNVTGRLLVGLRWWNQIQPDGSNEWIFESLEDMSDVDALDSRIFWTGLYGTPLIWTLFFIIAFLKLNIEWILIDVIALTLSGANIIGYTKCSKDAKEKMQNIISSGAFGALQSSAGSSIMSKLGGYMFAGGGSSSSSPAVMV